MAGIFPTDEAGGLPVRDADGNPVTQANVSNAYVAPATFAVSCNYNYLPSDCTARIYAEQINAFQSELLCLGVKFDPNGDWDCNSTCNLSTLFQSWWNTYIGHTDDTIDGNGSTASPYSVNIAGLITKLCADEEEKANLWECIANIYTDDTIDGDGTAANPLSVNITGIAAAICASDPVREALKECLEIPDGSVETDGLTILGDGTADSPLSVNPVELISSDAGNTLVAGDGDGGLFVPFVGTQVLADSTPGTKSYTVPAGVKELTVIVTGGGGGSSGTQSPSTTTLYPGAGGGGGGTCIAVIAVSEGQVIPYIVGDGGAPGSGVSALGAGDGTAGGTGGSSSFGTLVSATGGAGGGALNAAKIDGGYGGIGAGGINIYGGDGMDGSSVATDSCGTGGSTFWGGANRSGRSAHTGGGAFGTGASSPVPGAVDAEKIANGAKGNAGIVAIFARG